MSAEKPSEEQTPKENIKETPDSGDSRTGAGTSAEVGGPVEETLETLKEELAEAKDQALRAQAEMQNIRRRAEQDVEKAHKFALDRFAGDIIVVADNLERALATAEKDHDGEKAPEVQGMIEGVELTLKSLQGALEKHGIVAVNPVGEPFDPQQHEAIAMVPNPEMEPNSVMEVMQKGYTLNQRVIRAAQVVVVKEEP